MDVYSHALAPPPCTLHFQPVARAGPTLGSDPTLVAPRALPAHTPPPSPPIFLLQNLNSETTNPARALATARPAISPKPEPKT